MLPIKKQQQQDQRKQKELKIWDIELYKWSIFLSIYALLYCFTLSFFKDFLSPFRANALFEWPKMKAIQ